MAQISSKLNCVKLSSVFSWCVTALRIGLVLSSLRSTSSVSAVTSELSEKQVPVIVPSEVATNPFPPTQPANYFK